MLRCRDGSLYTGSAKDVWARLARHSRGKASRYTRARRPLALVWFRRVRTWSRALREEQRIKQLRRAEKEALVRAKAVPSPRRPRGGNVKARLALVLVASVFLPELVGAGEPAVTVLRCGRLIDGKRAAPLPDAVVVVEG